MERQCYLCVIVAGKGPEELEATTLVYDIKKREGRFLWSLYALLGQVPTNQQKKVPVALWQGWGTWQYLIHKQPTQVPE